LLLHQHFDHVEDACRIEHVISAESFDALKRACATHTELDFDANQK
jgi:Mn-dependent DtxR family transcriptional regulator